MKTVIDNLQEMADGINRMLDDFLLNHSSLYLSNPPGSGMISGAGDHSYRELQEVGLQVQSKLIEEYRIFSSLVKTLLRHQPPKTLQQLSKDERDVLRAIEHQHTWSNTIHEALKVASNALMDQINLLKNLFAPDNGNVFFLPDTNALLHFPILEQWNFDGVSSFTLVFTPTILSELDSLKINHRNESVRQKAETIISQIKEFRRRGRLSEGVTLVKGRSTILTMATEPKAQDSLDWLDPTNNDDRFLATIIEVMRLHPRSIVIAVSRDINFQNKAEFARIPFIEPPEPSAVS